MMHPAAPGTPEPAPSPTGAIRRLFREGREVLEELASRRTLTLGLWRNQTRARYAGSAAGALWAVISPLALIVVYTIIFSALLKSRIPGIPAGFGGYGFFVFAGTLPWLLVSQTVSQAPSSLLDHGASLRRFLIPPTVVPGVVVLTALTDVAVAGCLFAAILTPLGLLAPLRLPVLLPAVACLALAAFGLALAASALNLYGRDVSHGIAAFLPFWFFASPIAYPLQALPDWLQHVLLANPLNGYVELFRWCLLAGPFPAPGALTWSLACSLAVFLAGAHVFQQTREDFVDLL